MRGQIELVAADRAESEPRVGGDLYLSLAGVLSRLSDASAYAVAIHVVRNHDIDTGLCQPPASCNIPHLFKGAAVALSQVGGGEVALEETLLLQMPLSPEDVGRRIAQAREEKLPQPWSPVHLALALGVSPFNRLSLEKGRLPSMHDLMRLLGARQTAQLPR